MKLFFDVANTLLHKPQLWSKISDTLNTFGFDIPVNDLKRQHKILSETIKFPDKTNAEFYTLFNSKFLLSLGILPFEKILSALFLNCKNLPWEPFEDVSSLNKNYPSIGIISNWDSTLVAHLDKVNLHTDLVIGSANFGVAKPNPEIFEHAISKSGVNDNSDLVFVGDSLELDIFPAVQLGISAILIDRDNHFPHYSGLKIHSLKELPQLIHSINGK